MEAYTSVFWLSNKAKRILSLAPGRHKNSNEAVLQIYNFPLQLWIPRPPYTDQLSLRPNLRELHL